MDFSHWTRELLWPALVTMGLGCCCCCSGDDQQNPGLHGEYLVDGNMANFHMGGSAEQEFLHESGLKPILHERSECRMGFCPLESRNSCSARAPMGKLHSRMVDVWVWFFSIKIYQLIKMNNQLFWVISVINHHHAKAAKSKQTFL